MAGLIIAVDPGPDTGVAAWHYDSLEIVLKTFPEMQTEAGLVNFVHAISTAFGPFGNVNGPLTLIYERWEYRKEEDERKQQYQFIEYTAPEVNGAIRLWAAERRNVELVKQGASQAKGKGAFWGDDAKLKKIALWKPGKDNRHEMDALRHLLTYVTFTLNDQRFLRGLK